MNVIEVEREEVCTNVWETVNSNCPAGSIIDWVCVYAPPNVDPELVQFESPGAIVTRYKLPNFPGKYGLTATCRVPV